MPIYTYRCKECNEDHTEFRPIARRKEESKCKCGGECEQVIVYTEVSPAINYTLNDKKKVPSWVKEKFRALRETHKDSNLPNY